MDPETETHPPWGDGFDPIVLFHRDLLLEISMDGRPADSTVWSSVPHLLALDKEGPIAEPPDVVRHVEMDAISAEKIQEKLKEQLQAEQVQVVDTSGGCGSAFQVAVVAEAFQGKRLLERHQLVHQVLEEELKSIHAISITKTLTPEQDKQTNQ